MVSREKNKIAKNAAIAVRAQVTSIKSGHLFLRDIISEECDKACDEHCITSNSGRRQMNDKIYSEYRALAGKEIRKKEADEILQKYKSDNAKQDGAT
jgi:hypothetical protein